MKPKGQIYIFTGDGKGKTSAALGVAVRAVGNGMKVAMVQWYKQSSWDISEHLLPTKLKNFRIYPIGVGFRIKNYESRIKKDGGDIKIATVANSKVIDSASDKQHRQAAQEALTKAQSLLGKVDVLVLDEINNAIKDGLISVKEVITLISKRGPTHLIFTGRDAHHKIIKLADLVTEMKKLKHPFDRGQKAIKGLDF